MEIPDFNTYVTLPGSGNGHAISTVSHQQIIVPKEQWEKMRRRGLTLLPEDWAKLKFTLSKNCLTNKCKQAIGALDSLFEQIDKALGQLPIDQLKGGI